MSHECGNCKANPVDIARNTQGTPTAKLIAILAAHGITSAAEIAEIVGISDRAVRKARNSGSGTEVPPGTTGPELQDRPGTQVPKTELQDRNSGSAPSRAHATKELPSEVLIFRKEDLVDTAKAKPTRSHGSRLPTDWVLPKSWGEWAQINTQLDREAILVEADKFRDFWISKTGKDATKLDWEATWRNWCRNAKASRPYNPGQMAHDERKARLVAEGKPTTLREALNRRIAEDAAREAAA